MIVVFIQRFNAISMYFNQFLCLNETLLITVKYFKYIFAATYSDQVLVNYSVDTLRINQLNLFLKISSGFYSSYCYVL